MPRGRLWTEREDRLIREAARLTHREGRLYGGRYPAVAERIGRTENAVRLRASRIGASLPRGWEKEHKRGASSALPKSIHGHPAS